MCDVPSATAILDRFLHHAVLIPMNGRSYRLKDAPTTEKQNKKDACAEEKESV